MKQRNKQKKPKAGKPTTRLLSFQKHRPKWPPTHLVLPSTNAEIERGRPEQPTPARDDSRKGRLARLTGGRGG